MRYLDNFLLEAVKPHKRVSLVVAGGAFFTLLFSYSLVLFFVNTQNLDFDLYMVQKVQAINLPLFKELMGAVSLPGVGIIPILPFALVFWLLWRNNLRREAFFLPVIALAPIISEISKLIILRPRPSDDLVTVYGTFAGYSFPSGHVLFYTLFYGFVAFLAVTSSTLNKKIRFGLFFISFFMLTSVGISRIYLGAHWPTDVIAGYLLGFALLEIIIILYLKEIYWQKVGQKK